MLSTVVHGAWPRILLFTVVVHFVDDSRVYQEAASGRLMNMNSAKFLLLIDPDSVMTCGLWTDSFGI